MSNRIIVSPEEILFSSDVLKTNKNIYVGLGRSLDAIIGSTTQLNGFPCTPTIPASLDVSVGSGEIYIQEPTDPTAYGVLPVDNAPIVKQGIFDGADLSITPPVTPGNSINYLIQIGFQELDSGATSRAFYNSSNPSSPIFNVVDTDRLDNAVVQLKAGVPAPTGTQVTPTPDAGFIGAWVVTVANGQTTITSPNISVYTNAPFITDKLKDKISQAQGDLRYAQIQTVQSGAYIYAQDTGSVNALVASITPAIPSLFTGMEVHIRVANTNTGASTLELNTITKNIVLENGSALSKGALTAGMIAILAYDGTDFRLQNPAITSSILANGYIHLPIGLTIQWFTVGIPITSGGNSSTVSATFPIPFQNNVFSIVGSVNDPAGTTRGENLNSYNQTLTGFDIDFTCDPENPFGATTTAPTQWIAIGN